LHWSASQPSSKQIQSHGWRKTVSDMPVYIPDVHSLALDCAKGIVLTERFRWI
jgi:hypothetical protein